tara:strand:- start:275 stop:1330 length:1056 start_codon:yes stop_codon:yes gene_type:complete
MNNDIKETLSSLGYTLQDRGKYWQTNAIFRNGDNKTAIQIYKDTGIWKDYVAETPFMPFEKLIEITLGTKDKDVIKKYIKEEVDFSFKRKDNTVEKLEMEKIYPEDSLSKLLPHYDFYNKRGISTETLKFFKGGLATGGAMYQRYVFPIYNKDGLIHGLSGRDMAGSESRPKWKHMGVKSKWSYPLYVPQNKTFPIYDFISDCREVILVESIGDMLNLHENGHKNVLCTFGLDVSPSLICSLVSINPSEIIISLNNDSSKENNAGLQSSIKNYLKLTSHFDFDKISICLPNKNDFGDMSTEDIEKWIEKKSSVDKEKQRSNILEESVSLMSKNKLPKSFASKIKKLESILL